MRAPIGRAENAVDGDHADGFAKARVVKKGLVRLTPNSPTTLLWGLFLSIDDGLTWVLHDPQPTPNGIGATNTPYGVGTYPLIAKSGKSNPSGPMEGYLWTNTADGAGAWTQVLDPIPIITGFGDLGFDIYDSGVGNTFWILCGPSGGYAARVAYVDADLGTTTILAPDAVWGAGRSIVWLRRTVTGALILTGPYTSPKTARSTDDGVTWTVVDTSVVGTNACRIGTTAGMSRLLAVSAPTAGWGPITVKRSVDDGVTWSVAATITIAIEAFVDGYPSVIYMEGDTALITCARDPFGQLGEVFRTTDAGDTWTNVLSTDIGLASAAGGRLTLLSLSEDVAVLFQSNRVFRSSDAGSTWTELTDPYDIPLPDAETWAPRGEAAIAFGPPEEAESTAVTRSWAYAGEPMLMGVAS